MVSKRMIKRKRTVPPKRSPRLHGRRNKSPLKDIAAVPSLVAASVDRSIRSCRRRLVRVFTRLASLSTCAGSATPVSQKKRRKQGFLLLNTVVPRNFDDDNAEEEKDSTPTSPLLQQGPGHPRLPPPVCLDKMTLFLDLDETLVHTQNNPPPGRYDFVVHPTIDGRILTLFVLKRPGAEQLLAEAARRFEVVVFTAGLREYASLVLDRLDPGGLLISHHLYRDACREVDGKFIKDLAEVGRELSRVVLVDDNPNSYLLQPENAVPVTPFVDDPDDRELWRVMEFFAVAEGFEDTREAVKQFLCDGKEKATDQKN